MKRYYGAFNLPWCVIALVWLAVLRSWGFFARAERNFTGMSFAAPPLIFRLRTTETSKFTLSDHSGKVILLNFGFTNCPDICPTTLGILGAVLDLVGDERVEALFITVDPKRDTTEKLGAYIPFFHDRIVGLTGSEEAIKRVSDACGGFYSKEQEVSEDDYLVSHSPAVYLIGPGGEIVLRYPTDKLDPKKMADDIKRLLL